MVLGVVVPQRAILDFPLEEIALVGEDNQRCQPKVLVRVDALEQLHAVVHSILEERRGIHIHMCIGTYVCKYTVSVGNVRETSSEIVCGKESELFVTFLSISFDFVFRSDSVVLHFRNIYKYKFHNFTKISVKAHPPSADRLPGTDRSRTAKIRRGWQSPCRSSESTSASPFADHPRRLTCSGCVVNIITFPFR